MRNRFGINVVVLLGIAALFVSTAIRTGHVTHPNVGDVGYALTAVGVVVASYELLLWRWLPLTGGPPRLRGTWKMMLTPQEGPEGAPMDEKPCFLSIRQTASTIDAKLLFVDGQSTVTTAVLRGDRADRRLLIFYDFEPKKPTTHDPRRKGAASLDITQSGLDGKYWNDARTWGLLESNGRTRKLYDSYHAAEQGMKS